MGMRGNECREALADLLQAIEGVEDVDISLYRSRAVIFHTPPCTPAQLVWSIVNAGYAAALAEK